MSARETIAHNTYKKLIYAKSYGQQIGVDAGVYRELGLIMKQKDSLYDKWFKLWFRASDNKWKERIASSNDDANLICRNNARHSKLENPAAVYIVIYLKLKIFFL